MAAYYRFMFLFLFFYLFIFFQFVDLGRITSIEVNHKPVDIARKGQEVCIKIENIPGETPKLYGRHFDHTDMLMSKVSKLLFNWLKDWPGRCLIG